jgi:hypothetical protein
VTAIAILACTAAFCFALGYMGRSLYGALRLSELLGVLWILLAGPQERVQLRAVLAHRRQVAGAALSRPPPPERRTGSSGVIRVPRHPGAICGHCHETWRRFWD